VPSASGDKDSIPVGERRGGDLWPIVGRGQNEVISQKEETYVSLSLLFEENVQYHRDGSRWRGGRAGGGSSNRIFHGGWDGGMHRESIGNY